MTTQATLLLHAYETYQVGAAWGIRWWPDAPEMDEEEREALTMDSGARFESKYMALAYARCQMRMELAARTGEDAQEQGKKGGYGGT